MVECAGQGDAAACQQQLEPVQDVMRASSWDTFAGCLLDLDCARLLGQGVNLCLQTAMAAAPANAADGLVEAYCARAIACGQAGGLSAAECLAQTKAQAGEQYAEMGIFSDGTLDCLERCTGDLACEDLQNFYSLCSRPCGLLFGDSGLDCDHGWERDGVCDCDPGWAGTLCDVCAPGYVLDQWGDDCVLP
jgi:hypothetical protein